MDVIQANLYDHPKYYDLLFGSDCRAELRFLQGCFRKYGRKNTRRLFEPACGTGRLLIKLAKAGYDVAGTDLNPHAVDFCNDRLERHGFPRSVFVGDMSNFTVRKKFDAAFNTINSFRHLSSERQAENHLRCMADALQPGGLYLLGLHLTPKTGPYTEEESWTARRGHLSINSYMWTKERDLKKRNERLGLRFDIYTPTESFRLEDEMNYRTYSAEQFHRLLTKTGVFDIAETYDFHYRLTRPIRIDSETEDVVFVLRKRPNV
ncbi:MAG: class I SAM-dependent methyltransferase [Planctomycetaceae bacterium]|nr:class I SAM-dependent methyltransferase [Planctomycetaceae bacterium]